MLTAPGSLQQEIWTGNSGKHTLFRGGVISSSVNFIGHGVGLELDELPVIFEGYRGAVEDGMVIALEPKFVFDSGTVGYESTYAVRDGVCESMDSFDTEIQTV
jgi:Xaa-Pro aminopeptidase